QRWPLIQKIYGWQTSAHPNPSTSLMEQYGHRTPLPRRHPGILCHWNWIIRGRYGPRLVRHTVVAYLYSTQRETACISRMCRAMEDFLTTTYIVLHRIWMEGCGSALTTAWPTSTILPVFSIPAPTLSVPYSKVASCFRDKRSPRLRSMPATENG